MRPANTATAADLAALSTGTRKPASRKRKTKSSPEELARRRLERTLDGIVYDSKRECEHARLLKLRRAAGEVVAIDRQYDLLIYKASGEAVATHRVDFRIVLNDGTVQVHEVKGDRPDNHAIIKEWWLKVRLLTHVRPDKPAGTRWLDAEPDVQYVLIGRQFPKEQRPRPVQRRGED